MSHPKPADASVTPEEMASLRKAARKSADRSSDPDIVSFSDGREAAAYHAPPAAPPAAIDQTVSNGDVLLSSTLRREVALANEKPPKVVAEEARPAEPPDSPLETTVRASSRTAGAQSRRLWLPIALVAFGAVILVSTVALVVGRSSGAAPAESGPAVVPAPSVVATVATAVTPAVTPSIAPPESAAPASPSASTAPSAPPPSPSNRPHHGKRHPSSAPASSNRGSDGMIVPPL